MVTREALSSLVLAVTALAACSPSAMDPFGGFAASDEPSHESADAAVTPELDGGTESGRDAGGGITTFPAPETMKSACAIPAVGEAPMRRLTHREYANAVRDLLGADLARAFTPDTQDDLYDTTSAPTVPSLLADEYLAASGEIAQHIEDVTRLLGCVPAAFSEACVRDFVDHFGRRAFR
ncbi:MAG: DUF1587 domain-containing protein, partial [Polyangiales bacterium]